LSIQEIAAYATIAAAALALLKYIQNTQKGKTRTRAYKFREAGECVIHVKTAKLLEGCRVFLDTLPLSNRAGIHADFMDIDVGGANFDIPTSVNPDCKDVIVTSRDRPVYREHFDKVPYKNR
jgi:hypothetical protein